MYLEKCSIFNNSGPSGFSLFMKSGTNPINLKNSFIQNSPSLSSDITTSNIQTRTSLVEINLPVLECYNYHPIDDTYFDLAEKLKMSFSMFSSQPKL